MDCISGGNITGLILMKKSRAAYILGAGCISNALSSCAITRIKLKEVAQTTTQIITFISSTRLSSIITIPLKNGTTWINQVTRLHGDMVGLVKKVSDLTCHVTGKTGIRKGDHIVITSDVSRIRPRVYVNFHKVHKRL